MSEARQHVEMYLSFRSPYAWLGFERLRRASRELPVDVEYIPVFPPPGSPEPVITADARRRRYMVEDVERIAGAYGYTICWPPAFDPDWMRSHAAAVHALQEGRGPEFISAAFRARFERGEDLGSDDVLCAVAAEAGLDAAGTLAAADCPRFHDEVRRGFVRAGDVELFGVPFFVFRGQRYWGNDRLEWLIRDLQRHLGVPVPDLRADPLALPCQSLAGNGPSG